MQQKTTQAPGPNGSGMTNGIAPEVHDRRAVLGKLVAGGVALAGCTLLPEKWLPPFVEFGILPAHAATSGVKFPEFAAAYGNHPSKVTMYF